MRTRIVMLILVAMCAAATTTAQTPGPRRIQFGIVTGQENVTYADVLSAWQEAERLGFDSAWVFDHFLPINGDRDGPFLEAWTMLGALAAQTTKLRIGPLVTGNTYRNPALLAKMAATVDQISNGRLNLGIGAAWFAAEHEAYGFSFYGAHERAERLGEALEVITKLWTADHPSLIGKYYLLSKAPFNPLPVQKPHPPIVIGGKGKKWIMPLVARYGDGWNVPVGVSPAGVKARLEIVRKECQRIGRTPCDIEVSVMLPLITISKIPLAGTAVRLGARAMTSGNIARHLLAGSATEIQGQIQEYIDVGVTHVIVFLRPPFDHQLMRQFAAEVMPALRR